MERLLGWQSDIKRLIVASIMLNLIFLFSPENYARMTLGKSGLLVTEVSQGIG